MSKVIDINSARNKKPTRTISPDKKYIVSGELVILLMRFTKFVLTQDPQKSDMEFIGFIEVLAKLVTEEKFEEFKSFSNPKF